MLKDRDSILGVSQGGTGRQKFTSHGVLIGNDGGAINVTAAGATGQVLVAQGSASDPIWAGTVSTQPNSANFTGTTNTTGLMMGLNQTITPVGSGIVLALIIGSITNNTKGDGAAVGLRWGTGTAPINGAALTGTLVTGSVSTLVNSSANSGNFTGFFTLNAIVTGLTLSTVYWFDVGLKAITAGTATITHVAPCLWEMK